MVYHEPITRDGHTFTVERVDRVQGCGVKFDGRLIFRLRRDDGKPFRWLGSRTSKRVPSNARLSEDTGR